MADEENDVSETCKAISSDTSERQAQLLFNTPDKSIEHMLEYEEMLQENMALMRVHNPDKYRASWYVCC